MSKDDVVVGFVGLGIMGGRMVANLQKAGFKLVVHDLHRHAATHHLNAGAIWADTPRALASRAAARSQVLREVRVFVPPELPEPSPILANKNKVLQTRRNLFVSTCLRYSCFHKSGRWRDEHCQELAPIRVRSEWRVMAIPRRTEAGRFQT
jgi:hypothetical protein